MCIQQTARGPQGCESHLGPSPSEIPWQKLPLGILVPWVETGECSWLILNASVPAMTFVT